MQEQTSAVACATCKRPIASRLDLIVALWGPWPRAMHARCFGRALKRWQDVLIVNLPFNGTPFLLLLAVVALAAGVKREPIAIGVVAALVILRGLAWLFYERRLPDFVDAGPSLEETDPDGSREPTGMRCEACGEDVRSRRDLVVTLRFLQSVLMHTWCWARAIRTLDALRTGRVPLNGVGTILQISALVLVVSVHRAVKDPSALPYVAPGLAFAILVPTLAFLWARTYDRRLPE